MSVVKGATKYAIKNDLRLSSVNALTADRFQTGQAARFSATRVREGVGSYPDNKIKYDTTDNHGR
jgi:hypothetical protein